MSNILLHTKTYVPPLRPDRVSRTRLLQRLDLGLRQGCKLSLVCAPAGFGKTTLVTEWLAARKMDAVAWLSLDEGDNDLIHFLHYVDGALRKIVPSLPETAWEQLKGGLPVENYLSRVINDLAEGAPAASVLILDDYHSLGNPEIQAAVTFFLENKPLAVHVIIITRQDPFLPLSRWRARGQLNEIRLNDLRFTSQEAADFLNQHLGLDLSPQAISVLETRTEGWIAGLQLAAITIQQEKSSGSPEDFVQALAGDNRYVMDYLMDEVLSRQPREVHSFLLNTSILERMCAPLCDSLWTPTGEDGLEDNGGFSSAIAILEVLDRANLFMIPLDHERRWYRYHHLFAQLLRQRLIQEQGEARVADLHRRAAAWFAAQGLTHEAVAHAAAAKDTTWLADLLEKTLSQPAAWSRGEVNRILSWINQLPEAMIDTRPMLCMHVARGLHIAGDTRAGVTWLEKAERSLAALPASPQKDELLGIAAANWATFYVMLGEATKAFGAVAEALRRLPETDSLWRARVLHALALAYDEIGDLRQVRQTYEQTIELVRRTGGNLFLALSTLGSLSATLNRLGQLRQAEACCRQSLAQDVAQGGQTPADSMVVMALAVVQYEQNRLDEAEASVQEAIELAQKGGLGLTLSHSLFQAMLFRVYLARGDRSGAAQILREMDDALLLSRSQWERQRMTQEATRARLALEFGDLATASAWARRYEGHGPTQFDREEMDIHLGCVLWAEGKLDAALALLQTCLKSAAQAGRGHHILEIHILLARIYADAGQIGHAHTHLLHALEMAATEGYVRLFVAEGEPLARLLGEVRQANLPEPLRDFTDRLLAEFPPQSEEPRQAPGQQSLVEPLTERELEVLRYLAEGSSLTEIARLLYLSPNTLKAHTNTIYSKLDVHSRLQAVNRARELGLLPKA